MRLAKLLTLSTTLLSARTVLANHIKSEGAARFARMASTQNVDESRLNVLGSELKVHGLDPVTGFFRDGKCSPSAQDPGQHTLGGVLTKEFLEYSKQQGNDLMTPRGGFPGLKEGCRWCLCVERWKEAWRASDKLGPKVVPAVDLESTSLSVLKSVKLEDLKKFEYKK